MSKCKILLDCLSNNVGQNIYPVLGQNNGQNKTSELLLFGGFAIFTALRRLFFDHFAKNSGPKKTQTKGLTQAKITQKLGVFAFEFVTLY